MAAPVDAGRAVSSNLTGDPITVNLPASIAAGDLLIMVIRLGSNGTIVSVSSGPWSELTSAGADASDDNQYIYWKRADGSEGATVSVDLSVSQKAAAIVWRITGADDPSVTTVATGTSVNPNPPATPALTGDYLFLAVHGAEGENTGISVYPTNYVNGTFATSGTGGAVATNCHVAGASRQRTAMAAATEDPGTFTYGTSDDWMAWTIYIPEPPPATPGPVWRRKPGHRFLTLR